MEPLTLTIRSFNEKVKQMNQTNAKQLVLSAQEARNLHNDIYAMLNNIAELAAREPADNVVQIAVDGGGFK